jgi:hypothetical protein
VSPLKLPERCLYCGGTNWIRDKHWMTCIDCRPERAAAIIRETPYRPELLNKGIPRRNP